jgi:hypothetical protein
MYSTLISSITFLSDISITFQQWFNFNKNEQNNLLFKYFNGDLGWDWLKSNKYLYTSEQNNIQVDKFIRYENGIEQEINNVLPFNNLKTINLNIT